MIIRRTFSCCSITNFQAKTSFDEFLKNRKRTPWYLKKSHRQNVPQSSSSTEIKDNLSPPSSSLLNEAQSRVERKLKLDNKNERIVYLSKLLNCEQKKAAEWIQAFPQLYSTSTDVLDQRVSYLKEKNVDVQRTHRLTWLILCSSENLERWTHKTQTALDLEFELAVSFAKLGKPTTEKIKNLWNEEKISQVEFNQSESVYRNRIDYMAHRLECKPWLVTDMMAVVPKIAEHPFGDLKHYLHVFLDDALIHPNEILQYPGVFCRDIKMMEERVKILQAHNCKQIYLAFLRRSPEDFNSYLSELNEGQSLLESHSNLFKFLQEQLHCEDLRGARILLGLPQLRKMEFPEIERRINILLSQGLKRTDITAIPEALCESESVLEENLIRFKTLNVPPENFKKLYLLVLKTKYALRLTNVTDDDVIEDDDD